MDTTKITLTAHGITLDVHVPTAQLDEVVAEQRAQGVIVEVTDERLHVEL